MDTADGHDHPITDDPFRNDMILQGKLLGQALIVMMDGEEAGYKQGCNKTTTQAPS